jgi:hypothetical protein
MAHTVKTKKGRLIVKTGIAFGERIKDATESELDPDQTEIPFAPVKRNAR